MSEHEPSPAAPTPATPPVAAAGPSDTISHEVTADHGTRPTDGYSAEATRCSLPAIIEAILFVAPGPVGVDVIAQAAGCGEAEVSAALLELAAAWAAGGRALRLQRAGDTVQAVTAPELSPWVERFLGTGAPARLSPAAMETLAIIAYRQPVTRAAVEAIRGVSADRAIATLLSRGLIAEVGRLETAGRPVQFGTTIEFLQHLGLASLDELPPFARFAELLAREAGADAEPAE